MSEHHISDDAELKARVRVVTQYDDNPDELPESDLNVHLNNVKVDLELETGSTDWYGDQGLAQALMYLTCIEAKVSAENFPYESYQFVDSQVTVNQQLKDESPQFVSWQRKVNNGLDNAETGTGGTANFVNTSDYIG